MKNILAVIAFFVALVVAVLLGGCGTNKGDQLAALNWAATVQPADPVPDECKKEPAKEPKAPNKEASDKESAREARKLLLWGRAVRKDHLICQTWAKGQRP